MYLPVTFLFLFKETIPLKEQHIERTKKNTTEYIEGTCHTLRELIFVKIRFREFWSILRKLVPVKINGNVGDIAKMFHFSLTLSPRTPLPCSVNSIHYEHIGKIFHSPPPFPLPRSPPLWTLIHFWHIGKNFHFLLTPPPTHLFPCSMTDSFWTYWQNLSFFFSKTPAPTIMFCDIFYYY